MTPVINGRGRGSPLDPFERLGKLRLWRLGAGLGWLLAAAAVLGLLFAWWARLHLGRLWSSSVTKKAEHRVVDTGLIRDRAPSDLYRHHRRHLRHGHFEGNAQRDRRAPR